MRPYGQWPTWLLPHLTSANFRRIMAGTQIIRLRHKTSHNQKYQLHRMKRCRIEQPAQNPVDPVPEESVNVSSETPTKVVKDSASAATGKRVDKYTNTYLQPIKGFERPTKVAYISKRAHSYIALLQRYADLTGSKVSMQEIMENMFRQHITDHKAEIESIRTTLQQKEAELHE